MADAEKVADLALHAARKWMMSRPESIKRLMMRFPPARIVRTVPGWTLRCPAPGATGKVAGYNEPTAEDPQGLVMVDGIDSATGTQVRAQCVPDSILVESYWTNDSGELQDKAWVRGVIYA